MKLQIAALSVGLALSVTADTGHASVLVSITESATGVTAAGAGSLDLSGLTKLDTESTAYTQIDAYYQDVLLGPIGRYRKDVYSLDIPDRPFGSGGYHFPSSGAGDAFGITGFSDQLLVPFDYVSGSPLNAVDTFAGATIASLGLLPGTYVYTLPHDSFTIDIGTVPLPSSASLLGAALIGLAGFGYATKRRIKVAP